MTIAGASSTLIKLLQNRFFEKHGSLRDFSFKVFSSPDMKANVTNHVTLFLYRVHADTTRRHIELPRVQPQDTSRFALGLELRYLLTVWGQTAEGEQSVLSDCMEILNREAIVTDSLLDPAFPWSPGEALKVSLETMSNEDLLRLWDSLEPSYRLSVPYLVRTVRLGAIERSEERMVESATKHWMPSVA